VLWPRRTSSERRIADWRTFAWLFLGTFVGVVVAVYAFILLVDPYDDLPFSLPLKHRIVSISDRYMYPQVVRSKQFDSLIVGTSTSRLLDPELLDKLFHVRFANLAMDSARAWEQQEMVDLFLRDVGPPKVLIVGLDAVWCDQDAERNKITFRGFPEWLYDDNPWNDYLYMFNFGTLEIAARLVGYQFGLYPERRRFDGYEVFVPPESQYDAAAAHDRIWAGLPPRQADAPPQLLSPEERSALSFPALGWLDAILARLPASSLKILAFIPVNVAAQPAPGTHDAAVEAECKARIVAIAGKRGAKVIDWRIASPLTRNDANYWDRVHYRVPIATRIAEQLAQAALDGRPSEDGSYVLPLH
jgi:hypothetical protein